MLGLKLNHVSKRGHKCAFNRRFMDSNIYPRNCATGLRLDVFWWDLVLVYLSFRDYSADLRHCRWIISASESWIKFGYKKYRRTDKNFNTFILTNGCYLEIIISKYLLTELNNQETQSSETVIRPFQSVDHLRVALKCNPAEIPRQYFHFHWFPARKSTCSYGFPYRGELHFLCCTREQSVEHGSWVPSQYKGRLFGHREFYYKDNRISCTGKTTSIYWDHPCIDECNKMHSAFRHRIDE